MEQNSSGQETIPLSSFELEEEINISKTDFNKKRIIIYSIIGLSSVIIIGLIIFLAIYFNKDNNNDNNDNNIKIEQTIYLNVISNNDDEDVSIISNKYNITNKFFI